MNEQYDHLDATGKSSSHSIFEDLKTPLIISATFVTLVIIAFLAHKLWVSCRTGGPQIPPSPLPIGTPATRTGILPQFTTAASASFGTFRQGVSRVGALVRIDSFSGYQLKAGVVSAYNAVARGFGASLRRFWRLRRSRDTFGLASGRRNTRGGRGTSQSLDPLWEEAISSPAPIHVVHHHVEWTVTAVELGALERVDGEPPDL